MGDENMIDLTAPDLVFSHLHLCAFPAIDEENMLVQRHHLGGGMTIKSR